MNNQNIKLYLGISFALIILLVIIIVIPFSNKSTTGNQQAIGNNFPTPTSVAANGSINIQPAVQVSPTPITIPATSTGAIIDTPAPEVIKLSDEHKDLLSQIPKNFGTFSISFDYSQNKFIVTLNDPKDQAQKDFESWKSNNYSSLGPDEFILK